MDSLYDGDYFISACCSADCEKLQMKKANVMFAPSQTEIVGTYGKLADETLIILRKRRVI
jgi:hypothetical protein